MKYARSMLILFALIGGLNAAGEKLDYRDVFYEAMRLSSGGSFAQVEFKLQCKKDGRNFVFNPYSGYNDRFDADIQRLKESGISRNELFFVQFSEQQKNEDKIIVRDLGIIHIDSSSRFHFSFLNDPKIINIQLVNPKMKPFTTNALPKNSKIDGSDDGYSTDMYVFDHVRLWENNATDQKMTCDILFVGC
jgi:hypothetical protein